MAEPGELFCVDDLSDVEAYKLDKAALIRSRR